MEGPNSPYMTTWQGEGRVREPERKVAWCTDGKWNGGLHIVHRPLVVGVEISVLACERLGLSQ